MKNTVGTIWRRALVLTFLFMFPNFLLSQNATTRPLTAASTAAYGGCPAPATAGVRICQPQTYNGQSSIPSPFQLIASGTGAGGPVRVMQLWVDGVKGTQVDGNLFDQPVVLAEGTHRIVVVELDTTGSYAKSLPIYVTVVGTTAFQECPSPISPGINVCAPDPGYSCNLDGWTTVIATGAGATGIVRRMELWNSGVKLANFPGNTINTNLDIGAYTTITIVEVDTAGAYIKSRRILITFC